MSLYDDLIKHKMLVQKYAKKQANELKKEMKVLQEMVEKQIRLYGYLNIRQIAALKKAMEKNIEPIVKEQFKKLTEFYNYEARFSAKVLKKDKKVKEVLVVPEPKPKQIEKAQVAFTLNKPPVQLKKAYTQFVQKKIDQTVQILRDAEVQKQDPSDGIRNLFLGLVAVQSFILVGNAVNTTMNEARTDVIEANSEELEIEQVQWTAILDEATCPDCEALDGEVFPYDDYPDCPYHANCRCEVVPI